MPKELIAPSAGKVILREYQKRSLKPNEVRVRSEFSAEKHGTTLVFYKGLTPFSKKKWDDELGLFVPGENETSLFPMYLGNITVGTVEKVGEKVSSFKVGDRVYGYLPIRETHTVDEEKLHPVPPGLTDEEIVCIDPAVVALMSVREAHLRLGDRVAIFGLGAIGLLAVQMARLSGASFIVAIDPISDRRDLAKKYGADLTLDPGDLDTGLKIKQATGKKGVDVSIEASGSYRALQDAIRGTGYGGTIVPVSFYHGEAKGLNLGEEWHFNRHIMVSGARVESEPYRDYPLWDRDRIYKTVIQLFQRKALNIDGFLHIVNFKDILQAYKILTEQPNKWIKLAVRYKGEEK